MIGTSARVKINRAPRLLLFLMCAVFMGTLAHAQTPAVGAKAPDFGLLTPTGTAIQLSKELRGHSLVLVVLRGYPGYQCPYCQKQAHDFIEHASAFKAKSSTILLVYPGPPAALDQHAKEFLATQAQLPANVILVADPDYKVTNLYSLRWDAPNETAYPSTFVLKKDRTIVFENISHAHGDRVSAEDALDHLPQN
jgi:peroxiredoxin